MSRRADAQAALTFRLARRSYALPLRRTSGVRDMGTVRGIPGAPPAWLGLTDWSGHVLSVIDLPHVLGDAAVDDARMLVRLEHPHQDVALYVPTHLGLTQVEIDDEAGTETLTRAVGDAEDGLHWIDLDALIAECSRQAAS